MDNLKVEKISEKEMAKRKLALKRFKRLVNVFQSHYNKGK